MGNILFEFLAIRKEALKEKLVKASDPELQGRAKELSELLELFAPDATKNE